MWGVEGGRPSSSYRSRVVPSTSIGTAIAPEAVSARLAELRQQVIDEITAAEGPESGLLASVGDGYEG